ncbi:MAG: transketolase family protein [Armatimonadetes bacterium]|nr:transketolase family protein [Armatimonadota bacterium]
MLVGESIGLKEGKATRVAFGETLVELGHEDPALVVVDGDLNNSTRTDLFKKAHPDRFFNVGIAESNLVGVAGGLASCGKKPWIASFAAFLLCNAFDQVRMSIAFPQMNVKLVGSHGGISIGEDGPSQMGIEDFALASALPGFTVVVPADEPSTRALVRQLHAHNGPGYMRTGRPNVPIVYANDAPVRLGKAHELRNGDDVTLVACGLMVAAALEAAALLEREGLSARVLDVHTLKPLDEETIERAARETGRVVVAEEHLCYGGLGSIVAAALARRWPVPMRFVNLKDTYAESGKPRDVLVKYGLTAEDIVAAAHQLIPKPILSPA